MTAWFYINNLAVNNTYIVTQPATAINIIIYLSHVRFINFQLSFFMGGRKGLHARLNYSTPKKACFRHARISLR